MDLTQTLIFYAEWIFFTAWGMVVAMVSAIAFGRDILPATYRRRNRAPQG